MAIIKVERLTKEYRLGQLESLKTTVTNQLRRLTGKPIEHRALFKALDDVSFSVEEGEVLGIIGHNGAGKSTLLKLLAGITTPTSGTICYKGRIAPLIEVGAGFVPNLTGRENVYLNGAILGLSRQEISRKFDEIVDFAEMEEFIDTPVKRYSSGMQVKLAFAVATSINAEILIVDEVLAVGDLAFQRKCFERIDQIIKREKRTVLLVSHNIRQVERICSRVIIMDHGTILDDGTPQRIADLFYRQSNDRINQYHKDTLVKKKTTVAGEEVELVSINAIDPSGAKLDSIPTGGELRVRLRLKAHFDMEQLEVVIGTHTTDFFYLTASSTRATLTQPLDLVKGEHKIDYIVPSFPLVSGTYCIRCTIFDKNRRMLFTGDSLSTFNVLASASESREPPMRKLNVPGQFVIDETNPASIREHSP